MRKPSRRPVWPTSRARFPCLKRRLQQKQRNPSRDRETSSFFLLEPRSLSVRFLPVHNTTHIRSRMSSSGLAKSVVVTKEETEKSKVNSLEAFFCVNEIMCIYIIWQYRLIVLKVNTKLVNFFPYLHGRIFSCRIMTFLVASVLHLVDSETALVLSILHPSLHQKP